ncbi:MAG: thioredoxin [Clostridia bacterium]|nr:thioredoxin [Clostridia bacterium]
MVLSITTENFEKEVLQSDIPVLVDFYATWCNPCRLVEPTIEEIAKEFEGKIKVGKVDVETQKELVFKYKIMSVPTFFIFRDGVKVAELQGNNSKEHFVKKLVEVI